MSESSKTESKEEGGRVRLWRRLSQRSLLGVPVAWISMFVLGAVFWAGFNTAMDLSNTETFCLSCHVMRENVYVEYTQSIHYHNRSGVRAVCTDCHVPKQWFHKVTRKIQATTHEVPHWLLGTINTPEKFEARRAYLAERVWQNMRRTDSRECRNCHEIQHMDLEEQGRFAARRHGLAAEQRGTCIDCHQGIAHALPSLPEADENGREVGP